jgi:hypothetical protein
MPRGRRVQRFSFWNFAIPQLVSGLGAASKALQKGDNDWAESLIDSVESELERAKKQTLQQIADREKGKYNPAMYYEDGCEMPRSDPRHPEYEEPVQPDRNVWRQL